MSEEEKKYLMHDYNSGSLTIRKEFLPLIVCPGKIRNTKWYTIPEFDNDKWNEKYKDWFYRTFRDIIYEICKKRNIELPENQQQPSYNPENIGWYLPLAVHFEIVKMWQEENVPIDYDILRPYFRIYGKSNLERYVRDIMTDYGFECSIVDEEE